MEANTTGLVCQLEKTLQIMLAQIASYIVQCHVMIQMERTQELQMELDSVIVLPMLT